MSPGISLLEQAASSAIRQTAHVRVRVVRIIDPPILRIALFDGVKPVASMRRDFNYDN